MITITANQYHQYHKYYKYNHYIIFASFYEDETILGNGR